MIPLSDFDLVTKSYAQIYEEIENFLLLKTGNNYFNNLFCLSKDLEETRFGLEFLADHANHRVNIEPSSRVLDLESLLLFLIQHSPNSNKISLTPASAYDLLTSYTFDYARSYEIMKKTKRTLKQVHLVVQIFVCKASLEQDAGLYQISLKIVQLFQHPR